MTDIRVKLPVTIAGETREVEFIGHQGNDFVVSRQAVAIASNRHGSEAVHVFAKRGPDGEFLPSLAHGAMCGVPAAITSWATEAQAVA